MFDGDDTLMGSCLTQGKTVRRSFGPSEGEGV